MKYLTIKELPENERPYEKCEKYGPQVLSDSELLAIIIKSGNKNERSTELAYRILQMKEGRYGVSVLNHVSFGELTSIKGVGRVKAIQLLAVAELSKRMSEDIKREGISFEDSDSVAGFFMERMRHLEREETRAVFLDSRLKMISDKVVFTGTVGMAPMEPREILREALLADAVYFILLHNHPSGDPTPSEADINTTARVKEAGNSVGIRLKDHIIIGDNKYVSLKDRGLM
ncbi:MAG: DNA repair protein RadC [Lachnospiraceae bacterium]|jgi:DNA repair protein RadC|nr:DNA repair protein RadC [Lachnospiraceae bacterium]